MYDELVKRLRCQHFGNCPNCPMWYTEEVEPNLWRERCAAIDAADAIEQSSKPRWIPVTERLPEKNGPYLCCWKASADEKKHIARIMVWRADTGWMNVWDEPMSNYVTHWMPLPQPPEEE